MMPLIKLRTSVNLSEDKQKELLSSMSKILSKTIGKPEKYIMAMMDVGSIVMSGTSEDSIFVEIRSIGGLSSEANRRISLLFSILFKELLGVPAERVYINFMDIPASNWGWNGDTFG